MSKENVDIIMEELKSQGKMLFKDSATESQIKEFEEKNSIKLPNAYKAWLMKTDGGDLFLPSGVQLYGVAHKPLIDVNDDDRPDDSYVMIGALSFGDPVLFKKDTEEIAIYNHESGTIEEDEQFEDFLSFVNALYELLEIGE